MTRLVAMLIGSLLLLWVLHAEQAVAADEDTQASVYLVFDPETGDFVTVDDPSVTAQHAADQTQEEIESGTDSAVSENPTSASGAALDRPPMLLAIGGAAVVLIVAGVVWRRRSRQNAA